MLRLPAVAGRFYPSDAVALSKLVEKFVAPAREGPPRVAAKACLVPHAGYTYSGHVAGAVYSRLEIPDEVIVLGVRHYGRGEKAAINVCGAWRTPLGDVRVHRALAEELLAACPLLREDEVAHSTEHSLEVQLPFLQVLNPRFSFVPIALGTVRFEDLAMVGCALAEVIGRHDGTTLLLTTSDLNHYEDDATTRSKDRQAIAQLLAMDPRALYETCARERISMCGLGPAVAMLTALNRLGARRADLVRYATSADVSGDRDAVVGYAGLVFL